MIKNEEDLKYTAAGRKIKKNLKIRKKYQTAKRR